MSTCGYTHPYVHTHTHIRAHAHARAHTGTHIHTQDLTPVSLEKFTQMADVVLVKSSDDADNCMSEIYNAFM